MNEQEKNYNPILQQLFDKIHSQLEKNTTEWFILVYKNKVLLTVDRELKIKKFIKKYILSKMIVKNCTKIFLKDKFVYYMIVELNNYDQIEIRKKDVIGYDLIKSKISKVYYKKDSLKYYMQFDEEKLQIKTVFKNENYFTPCKIGAFLRLPDFIILKVLQYIKNPTYQQITDLKNKIGNVRICGHLAIDDVFHNRFKSNEFQSFLLDTKKSVIRLSTFTLAEKYSLFRIYKMVDVDSYRRLTQHIIRDKITFQKFIKTYNLTNKKINTSMYEMIADMISSLYCSELNKMLFLDYCTMYKKFHPRLKIPPSKTNNGFIKHHDIILKRFMKYELKNIKKKNIQIEYTQKQNKVIQNIQSNLLQEFDSVNILIDYLSYYKEAIEMKHCILSYFESAYQKKYVAFSVSKDNKNYTLGFRINNRNKNILVFDQLYGYKNQTPSSELQTQVLKALEVKLEENI